MLGWMNITIMEIHNRVLCQSQHAEREEIQTHWGMSSVVMDILRSWSLHSNTRSAWVYTSQRQCIQFHLPALLNSHMSLQGLKTVQPTSHLFLSFLCLCAHYHELKNSIATVLEVYHRVALLGVDGLLEVGLVDSLGTI